MPFDKVVQAVQQIEQATTLALIQSAVRSVARPLGYDRFVLFSANAARDEVVERIHWVEGDWFGDGLRVDAQTYIRHCPVNRHLLTAREPFFWSKREGEGASATTWCEHRSARESMACRCQCSARPAWKAP